MNGYIIDYFILTDAIQRHSKYNQYQRNIDAKDIQNVLLQNCTIHYVNSQHLQLDFHKDFQIFIL